MKAALSGLEKTVVDTKAAKATADTAVATALTAKNAAVAKDANSSDAKAKTNEWTA